MASILEIDTSLEFFFNVFGPAPPDAYDKVSTEKKDYVRTLKKK
jgi:hypothetical protein